MKHVEFKKNVHLVRTLKIYSMDIVLIVWVGDDIDHLKYTKWELLYRSNCVGIINWMLSGGNDLSEVINWELPMKVTM